MKVCYPFNLASPFIVKMTRRQKSCLKFSKEMTWANIGLQACTEKELTVYPKVMDCNGEPNLLLRGHIRIAIL